MAPRRVSRSPRKAVSRYLWPLIDPELEDDEEDDDENPLNKLFL
jgi:hypothetical protein